MNSTGPWAFVINWAAACLVSIRRWSGWPSRGGRASFPGATVTSWNICARTSPWPTAMPRPWAASNRGRTRSLNYELGHKTGWFDQRLRVNGALFYTDYRSYQTFHLSPFGATIANAERAHALGAEMEASVRLLTELELFASANYTRAEFDRYQFQGNNFDGKPINNIPAYTVTAGIDYRAKWGGLARLSWRRVGEFEFDETNTVGQSAHDLLDVRVGYVWKN